MKKTICTTILTISALFYTYMVQAETIPAETSDSSKNYAKISDIMYSGNTKKSPFEGHWRGFHYGFINYAEKSGFPEADWAGSFALQFNLWQYNIGFTRTGNSGLIMGVGLEYQRIRFANEGLSVRMEQGDLRPILLEDLGISNIRRSVFKTFYLTIPVLAEIQIPASSQKRFYLSGGVVGGVRMHSKTKVVYNDDGKQKYKGKGSFNMIPLKADVMGKIGYNHFTLWGTYTLTRLFKAGHGPDIHPYTIGLGITM